MSAPEQGAVIDGDQAKRSENTPQCGSALPATAPMFSHLCRTFSPYKDDVAALELAVGTRAKRRLRSGVSGGLSLPITAHCCRAISQRHAAASDRRALHADGPSRPRRHPGERGLGDT